MLEAYPQDALDELLANVTLRQGWDFSRMNVLRQPVPWNYTDVVARYLRPGDTVLDIGTGGGEVFGRLAGSFGQGLGIDNDPQMIRLARANSTAGHLRFRVGSERLETVPEAFDVIIDRHAPFDLGAIAAHLKPAGYFVTQQVGERNMACVKAALGQPASPPVIRREAFPASGLRLLAFLEYDVEYVVRDIESLVFWLRALDCAHADLDGAAALASVQALNRVLAGNVDERGFVTNEHRYLAIAQRAAAELRLAGGHRSGRRDAGYGTPRPPAGGARGPSGW